MSKKTPLIAALSELHSGFYFCLKDYLVREDVPKDLVILDRALDQFAGQSQKFGLYADVIQLQKKPEITYVDKLLECYVGWVNNWVKLCRPVPDKETSIPTMQATTPISIKEVNPGAPKPSQREIVRDREAAAEALLRLRFHAQPIEGCLFLNQSGEIEILDSVQASGRIQLLVERVNLQKRALFSNGEPERIEQEPSEAQDSPSNSVSEKHAIKPPFEHSGDFRTINKTGRTFNLPPGAATAVKILCDYRSRGLLPITTQLLRDEVSKVSDKKQIFPSKLKELFGRSVDAYDEFITYPRKGFVALKD